MKIRFFFLACVLMLSINMINAQNLITKKTYWDWSNSRLHETFTVIAGTSTMHGSYKKYNENGALVVSANYNKGALHGLCISYFGTPQKHILKSTNYVNGKKNGIEKTNGLSDDTCYPTEECVYKNDEMIEKTSYYTDTKERGHKKSHVKLVGDKQYSTNWYQNGQIEYESIFQVTPGNYENIKTPIQYTKYNETGIVIEKLENNILLVYNDDGKTLKKKDNLNTNVVELYDNGTLVKTIRSFKENEEQFYEVTLYKDNKPYSKVVADKNGIDVEYLRKQKELTAKYASLYSELNTMLPMHTLGERLYFEYTEPPYRKSIYESDKTKAVIEDIFRKHEKQINDITSLRKQFSDTKISSQDGEEYDMETSVNKIEEYVKNVRLNYALPKRTLLQVKKTAEGLIKSIYEIECRYTYGQLGYKDLVPTKNKKAYYAYKAISTHLLSKAENETLDNLLTTLQQYNTVCSKMIKWETQKISSIEKLFKKAETPEAQLEIFMNSDI